MAKLPQSIQKLRDRTARDQKISIYIPTHPKSNSQAINEDTTRFKNALQEIKNNPSYDDNTLRNTMDVLHGLLDDTEFWKHQDVGLAVFGDTEGYEYFHLPYEPTPATYIANDFVISPLIITQSIGGGFYVLDINLDNPRLCRAVNGTLVEVNEVDMPDSFQDTISNVEYGKELQHQATPRNTKVGSSDFHGHDPAENVDNDTTLYLRMVAKAVDEYMKNCTEPLILAGEESRIGNFRRNLLYENALSTSIAGNQEAFSNQQLYDAAMDIVASYYQAQRQALIDKLVSSNPEYAIAGAAQIQEAANAGRIERLYLPVYRHTTDTVRSGDFESIILQLPDDISELEQLVQATTAQGGEVLATEIDSYEGADKPKALCRF